MSAWLARYWQRRPSIGRAGRYGGYAGVGKTKTVVLRYARHDRFY